MKKSTEELEKLYGAKCMLTNLQSRLTYHHLTKKCYGGKETVENGAILNREAHTFLHKLEGTGLFDDLTEALDLYKICINRNETECLKEYESVQKEFIKRMKR